MCLSCCYEAPAAGNMHQLCAKKVWLWLQPEDAVAVSSRRMRSTLATWIWPPSACWTYGAHGQFQLLPMIQMEPAWRVHGIRLGSRGAGGGSWPGAFWSNNTPPVHPLSNKELNLITLLGSLAFLSFILIVFKLTYSPSSVSIPTPLKISLSVPLKYRVRVTYLCCETLIQMIRSAVKMLSALAVPHLF